jgi:hypothetical protein
MLGKQVIVRADKAGVFFGTLESKNDLEVTLTNVRKLYYWSGANAIEQIALEGVKNPNDCQFTVIVERMCLSQYIQIILCTEQAINNINIVPIWKK